jgi:hypothetical protein
MGALPLPCDVPERSLEQLRNNDSRAFDAERKCELVDEGCKLLLGVVQQGEAVREGQRHRGGLCLVAKG